MWEWHPTLSRACSLYLIIPNLHNSVLHSSLLKIKTTFMIKQIFYFKFHLRGQFSTEVLYSYLHYQSNLMISNILWLITQYIWLKEESDFTCFCNSLFPDTSEKLGSNTAPMRHLNWLSFTRCGRRCGPWLDVKLDVRIPYICVLNRISLGK